MTSRFIITCLTALQLMIPATFSFAELTQIPLAPAPNKPLSTVFIISPKEKQCRSLSAQETSIATGQTERNYSWIDPKLGKLIEEIKTSVQKADADKLKTLFHPRLKTSKTAVNEVLSKQKRVIGMPYTARVEKVWALSTLDGSSTKIRCPEDNMQISPLYGYERQLALWINVTGPSETAKIFTTLVPTENGWFIGNFQWQQWTHQAKESKDWIEEADKLMATKNYIAAWIYYDLAKKLINGASYFEMDLEKIIVDHQNKFAPGATWQNQVASFFPSEKVSYLASMLTTGGAGILFRFSIEKEISAHQIRENCKNHLRSLIDQQWFGAMTGIRCSYLLPSENPEKEGRLGGLYLDRHDLKLK